MLIIAKLIGNILKVLNSEVSPNQLAAGFAFGALTGLIPAAGLLPYVLLLLSFIININLVMVASGAAVFKLVSFALDPVFNRVGYALLVHAKSLKPFWTKLYNMPLLPYTRFNNTIVLGSLVIGILLLVPVFFLAKWLIKHYREVWRAKFLKLRVVQIIQSTSFFRYYKMFRGIKDAL